MQNYPSLGNLSTMVRGTIAPMDKLRPESLKVNGYDPDSQGAADRAEIVTEM